jgi:hypothetical protein
MERKALYKDPEYVLSFGEDDVVFVSIELLITKLTEDTFSLEVKRATIVRSKMEFAAHLIDKMTTEQLTELNQTLHHLVHQEFQDQLFTYFYNGELLP